MSQWKPIRTAPRGQGFEFLATDGKYIEKTWAGWLSSNGAPEYCWGENHPWKPTHWMPLPEMPGESV